MGAKLFFVVLLAIGLKISPATGTDSSLTKSFEQPNFRIPPPFNRKDLLKDLLVFALKTQGTSLEEILDSGNLEDTISAIDEAFGEKVIVIDDDLVKIDFVNFRKALTRAVHFVSRQSFASNPMMGMVFEYTVNDQIRQRSSELKALIDNKMFPVDVARGALVALSPMRQRNKREAISIEQAGFVEDLVFTLIRQQIAALVYPIRVSINETFNGFIDQALESFVNEAPTDDVLLVFDFTKNLVVRRVVDVLVIGRVAIDELFTSFVGSAASLRVRRDVNRQEGQVATQNGEVAAAEFLDFILYPIQLILGLLSNPLGTILGLLLGGLNGWLKDLVTTLLESFYPTVGQLVVSPFRLLLWFFIDFLLPCTNC